MTDTNNFTLKTPENPWEGVFNYWIKDSLQLLWPSVYDQIDWDQSTERLEWVLNGPSEDSNNNIVNLLYKVSSLKNEACLIWICLIEPSQLSTAIEDKLFKLSCLLNQHYQQPILPLVVILGTNTDSEIKPYRVTALDHLVHQFEFQAVRLSNWLDQKDTFLSSKKPFENIIASYLKVLVTDSDEEAQYQLKLTLHSSLLDREWIQEDFLSVYGFIDRLIPLSEAIDKRYHETIHELERKKQVSYLTSTEQFSIDRWTQKGFKAGIQHANQKYLKEMIAAGIERDMIKKVMNLTDRELNRLLIAEYI